MSQPLYATASDYYAFIGADTHPGDDAEIELEALLRRSSAQVDSHLRLARYATDHDGYPTDDAVREALRDATCAYAEYFQETDDVTGAGAISGPVKIGSVSLGGTAVGGASSRSIAETRTSDEAVTILRNAGLISAIVAYT